MQIAIIGAGLAGLACGTALVAAGHAVTLFDKGRAAGGRMSSRRAQSPAGPVAFDHGAQYMTAHHPAFAARIEAWSAAGLVAPWPAAGEGAWVGTPAMNAPLRQMAEGLDVRWLQRVEALRRRDDGWHLRGERLSAGPFDATVVALPAEQAAALLRDAAPGFAARAADTPSLPCWTGIAAFPARLASEVDVLRERGTLDWAARNSAKPGRGGLEAWVLHATPDWSRAHLEDEPVAVMQALLSAFADTLDTVLPMPVSAAAHRWRYARSGAAGEGLLWDGAQRLGVCGDWLTGPRVEAAWLSGTRLADAIGGTA